MKFPPPKTFVSGVDITKKTLIWITTKFANTVGVLRYYHA